VLGNLSKMVVVAALSGSLEADPGNWRLPNRFSFTSCKFVLPFSTSEKTRIGQENRLESTGRML